ncbi:polysaccharide biosynthesis protein [Pseudobdellovibrio exovorus]|uniref:Nucleotide sugar epimerase/dehydratase n=1 Tax=Pseudobdellovibrio exovorus JSS TaxID=1184267 RepID=M4VCB5_9BACT|nr:nucleoside-diphosphate sugar epimerase/dehydratase [Pseudobdellovibrio exovorus]AGH95676.1 nucleotide sugar epimerase/dehydratase [Pseudobdellovibrio exovorus JSS]
MHMSVARLPRRIKILIVLFSDLILLPLALWSAVALRFGTFQPYVQDYWWLFGVLPLFTIPIFARLGLYRAVIRYVDTEIMKTVLYGVTISVLLLTTIVTMTRVQGLPRSSIIIYWILSALYIAASRYLARGILLSLESKERYKQKVAIYGGGKAGLQTALALMNGPEYKPVLFFDDNVELHGTTIAGIRVFNPKLAEETMLQYGCNQLLLAVPSAPRSKRREIIRRFEGKNIHLKTIPGMGELVTGQVKVDDIREVGIEDLLGRDPVPPFEHLISVCIEKKVVLVTGAGGSIGSELCRQILRHHPARVILFERSEYLLYKIERELSELCCHAEVVPILGDVLDKQSVDRVIRQYDVKTIYHAAAYKHVPLVEANIVAGVMNNVFGTLNVAKAAIDQKVETFVLISTDKAVRPTNVMGATKRLAELILQALASKKPSTRFCMVRFGNVLGSSGSVVPLFREQIRNGGPVTVTHPEVTRYFMTIPEASQLVLQAGAMGAGGEVFVLDMGESVRISDLAKKMIVLSGLEVKDPETKRGDIAIQYIGLRPGEKLYEELLIGYNVGITQHPRIMKADEDFIEFSDLMGLLELLKVGCDEQDAGKVIEILRKSVKEYLPAK